MCKINSQGDVLWSKDIVVPLDDDSQPPLNAGLFGFIPGVSPILMLTGEMLSLQYVRGVNFSDDIQNLLDDKWIARSCIGMLVQLLLCAALVFVMLKQRGASLPSRLGWSFFALLGAIPAVLAMWVLLLDEKRIRCPACRGKRLPSLPNCPRCAAPWPAVSSAKRELMLMSADPAPPAPAQRRPT